MPPAAAAAALPWLLLLTTASAATTATAARSSASLSSISSSGATATTSTKIMASSSTSYLIPDPDPTFKECYCIFARPTGHLASQLRAEISHLAKLYDGPIFDPHVTVLPAIERPREEVLPLMKELAAQVKRYRIHFTEVTHGTFYYQCVFLLVAKDEGTMAAAAAARNVYGMTTPPYMPHLSLLYADFDDEKKSKIAEEESARLYGDSSDKRLPEYGFDVESLELWYTPLDDKSTQSWRLVEAFPLAGPE